jgi:polyribonucleotide nucleotidyltransferase
MHYQLKTQKMTMPDGKEIHIETGKLAKQADGSVVVKIGNTMLLATVCSKTQAADNVDFLPLMVDYQEKYASVGRFPGGFFKREARLSDYEVLISRLVDRAIRPLFPDDYHAVTQVLISLISSDDNILPDSYAALAASAALSVSDIPFNGPISEVRVARINGKLVINPYRDELANADLDLIVSASMHDINMVEGEMNEVSEEVMIEALKLAHEAIKEQCKAQLELAKATGKTLRTYSHEKHDVALKNAIFDFCLDKVYAVASEGNASKQVRKEKFERIREAFIATLTPEEASEKSFLIGRYFHDVEKKGVRKAVLNERRRLDGRALDEIRPIWCEVDYLPSAHGSAIFTRGETQSLTSITLGSKMDEQIIDGAVIAGYNKFLLHYNFPPFSTGEVKPQRGTGRREVGHGNLAMRGLKKMLPDDSVYTIRVVSDVLESNGSSSMATVCAGSMALMDAGIKMKKPVAGIAMGLISDSETKKFAVLSDILGDEDHLGDMDFKVVGTKDGITACQMDIKVDGLSYELLSQALLQAKAGRLHILSEMEKAINQPREDYKSHAPRIVTLTIAREFIGAVIGPGGKIIQEMQRESGTTITIEEVGEFGKVEIMGNNREKVQFVIDKIKGITAVPELGDTYKGKVRSIQPYGAFVEFLPGKDGLLHISEVDHKRLESLEGVLAEGDIIDVQLIGIDKKTGKYKLSRKSLLPKPEGHQQARAPRIHEESAGESRES